MEPTSQIDIAVAMTANTRPGADAAVADVNRVSQAEQAAAAKSGEISFEEARQAEIMREYGVAAQEAARALDLLGPAAVTAAVGSAELDAAVESAQRETAALGTATDALAAKQARASAIATTYGVDLNIARMAMSELGEAAMTVALDSDAMEVALNRVQEGQAALQAEQAKTVAAMEALAEAETEVAAVSDAATAAMARYGIAQAEVEAASIKTGKSLEATARAMVQIKQAALAKETAEARAELEGLATATEAQTVTATESAAANTLDADALHQRTVMMRRTSDGLVDVALGGRRAIQGIADLQYVAAAAVPEAALLIGVLGGVALVGELWERVSRKMGEDSHKATTDIKGDWNDANAALKESMADIAKTSPFLTLLDSAKLFTEELGLQENMANSLQAALDRLDDAKFGQKESALNLREQVELSGKSGKEADAIRLKYDQQRDTLRSQHDEDKAARDLEAQKTKLAQLQDEAAAIQAQMTAADRDVTQVAKDSSTGTTRASLGKSDYEFARDRIAEIQGKQRAAAAGQVDGDDKAISAPTADEMADLFSEQSALPRLLNDEQTKGPQYTNQIERLKQQRDTLQKQAGKEAADAQNQSYDLSGGGTQQDAVNANVDAIGKKYAQLFSAIDAQIAAFSASQDGQKKVSDALEKDQAAYRDGQKKLEENKAKQDVAQKDIEAATIRVSTAQTNTQSVAQKDLNAIAVAKEAADRKATEDKLQAQINELDAKLANPSLPVADRETIEKNKAGLEAQKLQNQGPDVPAYLVKSQVDKEQARGAATVAKQQESAEDNSTRAAAQAITDHGRLTKDVASKSADLAKLVALQAEEQGKVNAATSEALDRSMATIRDAIAKLKAAQNSMLHTHQS